MIPRQLRRFINRLEEETQAGQLSWSAFARNTYTCEHNGYVLHLTYYFDDDRAQSSYTMTIKKPMKGAAFQEGRDEAYFSVTDQEVGDFNTLRNLFEAASVQAVNLDDILTDFFKA